jgi:hypothetical protein
MATRRRAFGRCRLPIGDACALLAFHLYQNKDHFGQQSFQVGTAEITQVVRDIDGLLGAIKAAFGHLRPVPIG